MRVFAAANDCCISNSKLDSSFIIPDSKHGHAAESQLGFQNEQEYRGHGQLGFRINDRVHDREHDQLGFHEEQGGDAKAKKLELENAKTAGRLGLLHSLPSSSSQPLQLGLHNQHELTNSQLHMTYRRLAVNGGTATATTPQVSPSIVVIIIVLTVIFFLSAFLHLLIRWLARNPALIRRGARSSANGSTGSNNRIIALTALQGQLQQLFSIQDAGLERSLIEELPVFSYKAAMSGLKEGADCAICLCEFVSDDQLRLLPSCGHAFHMDCIDTWLLSHSTCPLCRTLLLPECWLPGSLQPLLSSEMSTVGEPDHQQPVIDAAVRAQSGRYAGLGSSSRRSSLSRITVIAGGLGPAHVDQNQSHLAAEPHTLNCNGTPASHQAELCASGNPVTDTLATNSSRGVDNISTGLASFDQHEKSQNSIDLSKLDAPSEAENCATLVSKMSCNELTSSALLNSMVSSSSAAVMSDSGHLSYTSVGNNTDYTQSGRYSDQLERASAYGSGRRVSVHLGKCRVVNERSKSTRRSKASGGASRRSYSKGSYEYVIDSSSNLEVLIPSNSKPPPLMSSSRLNDLLNLSHRLSDAQNMPASAAGNGPRVDSAGRSLSPIWAGASFRKLRLCNGGDTDASINARLNTSQPSDKLPVNCNRWPADIPTLEESSRATSMRANVGSDTSFSSDSASQKLRELNVVGTYNESGKDNHEHENWKRAVSFRLPTPANQHVLSAKLRASASRRALSESEALSHWEPSLTAEECNHMDHEGDDRIQILDEKNRSSSFAKRTMDWLVGWPRRMVHPDKSASNTG